MIQKWKEYIKLLRMWEQWAKKKMNAITEEKKSKLISKLDWAESWKEEHLKEIIEKAKIESEKIDENAFAKKLV